MDAMLPGKSRPCPRPDEVLRMMSEQFKTRDQIMDFSSFSPSLYDTAWLSLVPTKANKESRLFPQCLDLLLAAQQEDGTWPSYACLTDGILTSLAALSSIAEHRASTSASSPEHDAFTRSIDRGVVGAQDLLRSWGPDGATHVGFEIIAPALLRRLDHFNIQIDFPERTKLMHLHQQKMSKFAPEILYCPKQTTLLHSVEAFFDMIEFERITHHCTEETGIFGSPAATAAYLMYSSTWDGRAERYLQKVVAAYGGSGSVPCAFPTPLFELSWAISTMFSPVVGASSFQDVDPIASLISETIQDQHGLMGFAPGILEDADDTARCQLMLMRLNATPLPDIASMVAKFEAGQCFKTYELERNPSFSANCNVVLTLLEAGKESMAKYASQIEKALSFLLDLAESADRITDKWNISSEYSSMLLVEVFVRALEGFDAGFLVATSESILRNRTPKTLCRIISQILATQNADGSWAGSLEVTSYSILMLSHSLRLPWSSSIREMLAESLAKGQMFVTVEYPKIQREDYLWIEKTTFESSLLRMVYCSVALNTASHSGNWSSSITDTFSTGSAQSSGMKKLFGMLPLLKEIRPSQVDLVLVEAKFHAQSLISDRDTILPRGNLPLSKDQYLEYIPIIWLLCNQLNNQSLSPSVIVDMLKLSQLTFQVDEYMETTIAGLPQAQVTFLESWIESECSSVGTRETNGTRDPVVNGDERPVNGDHGLENGHSSSFLSVLTALGNFIRYVLLHEATLRSPRLVQRFLAHDLAQYLLAHMRQNSDNAHLGSSDYECSFSTGSYFSWARSTGANHTSCPFAFRFFLCLVSKSGPSQTTFHSAQAQYFASSIAQHLAAMCRQYNDYGSVQRDAAENNLNSVDFAEFHEDSWVKQAACDSSKPDDSLAKENLMAIAEFERKLMEVSFQSLAKVVSSKAATDVKVLVDVTDLFGQLYVAKDIASRKRSGERLQNENQ